MEKLHQMVAAIVILVFFFLQAESTHRSEVHRSRRCGIKLMTDLMMVCGGTITLNKRTMASIQGDQNVDIWGTPEESSTYPFRSGRLSRALLPYRLKRQVLTEVGLADECCKKSCTMGEMATFCDLFL